MEVMIAVWVYEWGWSEYFAILIAVHKSIEKESVAMNAVISIKDLGKQEEIK